VTGENRNFGGLVALIHNVQAEIQELPLDA
jgi:hypothetical protein